MNHFFARVNHAFTTLVTILFLSFFGANIVQAAPPAEFEKTEIIGDLNEPTAFRFLPDGRIFISEKGGAIKVVVNGILDPNPVVTMVVLNTEQGDERGLLGIEPDPDFAQNGYLYVAYTNAENHDQISRITVSNNTSNLNTELVLLESNQAGGVFHHGGELRFGPDGKLYWAVGMNTFSPNSQLLNNVHGKIHRINKDGSIPADNPFVNNPFAMPSIWAYGLRNPFRFDFLPNGKVILGDVGGSLWEEVDVIEKGGDYGWPNVEGMCNNCGSINPLFVYHHTPEPEHAGAITAAMFYDGDTLPAQYKNTFFYGDYVLNFIKYLVLDENQESVLSDNMFDDNAGTVVQLEQGPDGNIYQMDFYPGALYKIALSDGNRAPTAKAQVSTIAGLAPLTATFSAQGSFDSDNTPLTYHWNFGDNTSTTSAEATHTYTTNGTYTATLTVSDGEKTGQASVTVTVGNQLPTATITSPVINASYNAGDTISFSGEGTDPENGTLPDSAFTWTFRFHHGTHTHPYFHTVVGAKSGTMPITRDADNLSNTWYAITLTVTDQGGLQHTTTRFIYPNLTTLTFQSNSPGTQFTVDGVPYTSNLTEQAVVGVERVVSAITPQFVGSNQYGYVSWSDGGAQTHTITTPATNTTYQVNYEQWGQPPAPWQTNMIGIITAGDSHYVNGEFTINSSSEDIWGNFDGFYYINQPLVGDGEIVARVKSQTNSHPYAKAGVIIKQNMNQFSPYALAAITPNHGYTMQYNYNGQAGGSGGAYTPGNAWIKLKRVGNVFTSYSSSNGTTWTQIGQQTIALSPDATVGIFMTSHDSATSGTAKFDNVSVTTGNPQNSNLTAPWLTADIGAPALAGTANVNNNIYTLQGGGNDIWGNADQFRYAYQTLEGDGQIVAQVASQTNTNEWAKAGVMIKKSAATNAPYAIMGITPTHGYTMQYNFNGQANNSGGTYTAPNAWVKLKRVGNLVTGYSSPDGINWNQVGTVTLDLNPSATIGLFATSHNGGQLSTATFQNVRVLSNGLGTGLPASWGASDVGSPTTPGTTSYDSATSTFTIRGAGNDIWGDTDQFQFTRQILSGNGEIIARVKSQTNTNEWAKAGIIMKDSASAQAPYALVGITPTHGTVFQRVFNASTDGGAYTLPNAWLKLKRNGNIFSAYTSSNGTTWNLIGSSTITMNSDIEVGLFVTSHNGGQLSTATFDNVSIQPIAANPLPAGWSHTDVGAPTLSGDAQHNAGVYTISGAGHDIWGNVDQFHYASQTLVGDGQITARVTSQTNTNPWAKAGVMMKNATTTGSNYAMLAITPSNGAKFQYNFNGEQGNASYTFPNAWVRLTRLGNTITAETSSNGSTWTTLGSTTVTLNANATIGLFTTSHNGGVVGTATFDNVTVTP